MFGKSASRIRRREDVHHGNEERGGENGEQISFDIVHKSSKRGGAMSQERKGEKEHRRTNGNCRNKITVNRCELVKQPFLTVATQKLGKKRAYLPGCTGKKKLYQGREHQKQ